MSNKKIFIVIILLILNLRLLQSEAKTDNEVSQLASRYMNNIICEDYDKAFDDINPDWFKDFRDKMFPLLIKFVKSNDKKLENLGLSILGNDENNWEKITGKDIVMWIFSIYKNSNKSIHKKSSDFKIEIVKISYNESKNKAKVDIKVIYNGKESILNGYLIHGKEKWYVEFDDEKVNKFYEMLTKAYNKSESQ